MHARTHPAHRSPAAPSLARRSILVSIGLALGAGPGCGPAPTTPEPATRPGRPRRVALAPTEPGGGQERVVRTLDATGDGRSSTSIAAPLVRRVDGRAALALEDAERQHVAFAGPFEPERYARLAVHLHGRGRIALAAQWRRAGETRISSFEPPRIEGDGRWQVALLDFPRPAADEPPFDELRLVALGAGDGWYLGPIDLIERPLRHRLPRIEEGGALIAIGNEARHGYGLSSATPLAAELSVPPGARLEFAYGWPDEVWERRPAGLVVELEGAGRRERVDFDLIRDGRRWRDERIGLQAWEGGTLRVTFRLLANGREALCALGEPWLVVGAPRAPTVLLITSDTHRADHVGPLADGASLTPAIDALAARGVRFTDCIASTNVTLPSHVALMTGVHPRDTGVHVNKHALSAAATTLAERFRDAGWRTFAAVSMRGLGRPDAGVVQGFERVSWSVGSSRPARGTLAAIAPWWPLASGQPLFCWLHFFDAHAPYEPPAAYERLFYPADRDPSAATLPEPAWEPEGWLAERDPDWHRAQYKSEVRYLDDQLARLFRLERLRDGIVAFTADHGESLGEHDIWFRHAGLYTEAIRVPLVLAWPGGPTGVTVRKPVRQIDVGRTLLALAEIEAGDFPGRDLSAAVAADASSEPRFALANAAGSASVTQDGWHLVLGLAPDAGRADVDGHVPHHDVQLFDLARDPLCERDLADAEPARARRLRALLVAWLADARDLGWSGDLALDEAQARELALLGYADDLAAEDVDVLFDPDCRCERCESFGR